MHMVIEPSLRLRTAIIEDNLSITLRLLKRFPDLIDNRNPDNGWTNLHYASYYGHYLITSNLIKLVKLYHSDDNEVKLSFDKNTYLHVCVLNKLSNNEQTLHLLLQNFKNFINLINDDGKTAVHLTAENDLGSCLQLLTDFGADLSIQDGNGDTALHLAMKMGNIKCIKVLLSLPERVNMTIRNNCGFLLTDVANSFDTIKMFEYFKKTSDDTIATNDRESISTPSITQKFQFSSASSTPGKTTLPRLPSVTTSRRYSASTSTNSPIEMMLSNNSALSLSSSGSSVILAQPVMSGNNATTPLSRSRSTSIKSEYLNPSPKKLQQLQQVLQQPQFANGGSIGVIAKKKRSNTLEDMKVMDDIEEEAKDNTRMIKKLSSSSNLHGSLNASGGARQILNILIKGKSKASLGPNKTSI